MIGMRVDRRRRQFSDNGKLYIMELDDNGLPVAIVPVYIFEGDNVLLPYEKFGIITDREANDIVPMYAISNYGRVWHIYSHKFISPGSDREGYSVYSLQRRSIGPILFRAHRLVMTKFRYFPGCEDTSEFEINHRNGIKTDNYIDIPGVEDNLEWIDRSGNILHAYEHNLQPEHREFYTERQIHNVCNLLEQGNLSYSQIEDITGVKYGTIAQIKRKVQWTFISDKYNF